MFTAFIILFLILLLQKPKIIVLEHVNVTRVVDGDTFELIDGRKVRLICVNTPEKGESGYKNATEYLRLLVEGKEVSLEKDVSETDRYGRLLRYVYVESNDMDEQIFVNKEIVSKGYAKIFRYGRDTKRCGEIEDK